MKASKKHLRGSLAQPLHFSVACDQVPARSAHKVNECGAGRVLVRPDVRENGVQHLGEQDLPEQPRVLVNTIREAIRIRRVERALSLVPVSLSLREMRV